MLLILNYVPEVVYCDLRALLFLLSRLILSLLFIIVARKECIFYILTKLVYLFL